MFICSVILPEYYEKVYAQSAEAFESKTSLEKTYIYR